MGTEDGFEVGYGDPVIVRCSSNRNVSVIV